MRVVLRGRDTVLAERELAGPLLVVPPGTVATSQTPDLVVLEPAEIVGERPDLLVGSVPLVWWNAGLRAADVSFLDVPPPPPFAASDVESMWEQLLGSALPLAESVPLQGGAAGGARVAGQALSSEAVPRAIAACKQMLQRWPEEEVREIVWRPADMRGGREDLRMTDRRAGKMPGTITASGVAMPDRIARRQRSSIEWRSERLAAVCRALGTSLREREIGTASSGSLTLPLDLLATRATDSHRSLGPPASSWPSLPRATFAAVMNACVSLAVSGRGERFVPLSHVWRLYENWLGVRAVEALGAVYRAPHSLSPASPWSCQWVLDGTVVRLHAQGTVGAAVDAAIGEHPDGVLSVSSDLRPDVLLSIWNPDGAQALVCIDAKQRTARTAMEPAEVASAASKYLWGIRSGADAEALPVASTIIVSSSPLPEMHEQGAARISTRFLLPSTGGSEFDALVVETVRELVAAVDPG